MTVQEWAAEYIKRGYQVVPLAEGGKQCVDANWKTLIFQPDDFRDKDNIGIRSVKGLIVIDVDSPEAVACADAFLPATGSVYGRPSKIRSKRLYLSTFSKTIAFKDSKANNTLIEIRADHQDMAPPSVHPSGEVLAWEGTDTGPAVVEPDALLRATRLIATTALVSRYYNGPGARHDWCLALTGTLRAHGIEAVECESIIREAAKWAHDEKVSDRILEMRSTYERPDDVPTTGAKSLINLMEAGKEFIASLNRIWGTASSAFILNAKGDAIVPNNQENIKRALEKLKITLRFDEFAQKPWYAYGDKQGIMQDSMVNAVWLEIDRRFHFRPSKDFFFDVVMDIAMNNPFHPVLDYLKSLKWDGVPRVDTWLIASAGTADTPYVRAVSSLVLIAAVRRVVKPGCKFDEMMVLESGQQGLNKSTALRTLCPNDAWFSDDLPMTVDSKQIIERTTGKWIIEVAELSGMHKTQVEHIKAMTGRQVDGPARMAYARLPVEQRRQFIMIATTNSHVYLTDITGNRRFWPIRIEGFDIGWIREHRDQLWAEAYTREQAGESIRLDPSLYQHAAVQQERRRSGDPWEHVLAAAFDGDSYRLALDEIFETLGVPIERQDDARGKRVAAIMQQMGFRPMTVTNRKGKAVRGWGKGGPLKTGPKLPLKEPDGAM